MLKTMVSLIDAERATHVQVHDALVDVAMAALSAEPVTVEEWQAAMPRFVDAAIVRRMMDHSQPGHAAKGAEGGQLIMDFTAQLLVKDTPIPEIPRLGNVQTCDEHTLLDVWLPYRIPDDWEMMCDDVQEWEKRAGQRRGHFANTRQADHRQVLYGKLAEWLVEQWCTKAGTLEQEPGQLQELWLLTPREDLQGQTPRQVLLAKHKFIDGDIQDQGQNWSLMGRCPPGLSPRSHAYRFGGFGTHEIILYHEMTVHLLLECERRIGGAGTVDKAEEIRHLEQLQQEWLHQPHQALYDQSPAAVIARERARLPAVVPPEHADEHDDCPLCRMMHDSNQPMIWQLDSFSLDHCFATSFYDDVVQWQVAQDAWESMCQGVEQSEQAPSSLQNEPEQHSSVWQRSHTNMHFFDDMPALEACAVMMFSIGGHMAELIHDLKPRADSLDLCRELHEAFDDLRVVFKDQEDGWMIRAAAGAFTEVLQHVTRSHQDLAAKSADLEDKLDFLCRRYQEHNDPYSPSDQP